MPVTVVRVNSPNSITLLEDGKEFEGGNAIDCMNNHGAIASDIQLAIEACWDTAMAAKDTAYAEAMAAKDTAYTELQGKLTEATAANEAFGGTELGLKMKAQTELAKLTDEEASLAQRKLELQAVVAQK